MNLCPPSMRLAPSGMSVVLLLFLSAGALYVAYFAVRAMVRGRWEIYKDARLNPAGAKAMVHAVVVLLVTWLGFGGYVWVFVCGRAG
jgi:hypothetical protein